jgi:FAD/FMN-containing dehydrogenase
MPKSSGSWTSRRDFIKATGAGALSVGLGPLFLPRQPAQIMAETVHQELKNQLHGDLLRPGDAAYDTARTVWNAMVDRHPALIVRCAGVADVINSVNFARQNNLPVSVRGGGHNVAGNAVGDDGIMLDLSRMGSVRVDPVRRTARAEPGLTWGEFDRETQAFGLATTGGACSQTGIAGVTLGGGQGWLMRKYGLALDNLLSADVLTADGQLRKVSAAENADLFFGIRGAQSNFGVVTSFEYRLHPVGPKVMGGMVLYPLQKAKDVLKSYRKFNSEAPEEMSTWATLGTLPDRHPIVSIAACYIGSAEAAEKVVRPLKEFGSPIADMIQPMPYVRLQSMFDGSVPPGRFYYSKGEILRELSDGAIDALVDGLKQVSSPYSSVLVVQLGGAIKRFGKDGTALKLRVSPYNLVIQPAWSDPAESERQIRWADELWKAMQPFSSGGVYVNDLGNEGEERVRAAYGANYERLVALKNKYDPANLSRFNQNIRPTFRKSS